MELEVIQSNDGSSTIRRSDINETYHSIHGALNESRHVFIKNGLELIKKSQRAIFEVGFGTGLNVMTTLEWAAKNPSIIITMSSIEAFPIKMEVIKQLNYGSLFDFPEAEKLFLKIHEADWDQEIQLTSNFKFKKIHADYLNYATNSVFDCIYFDAFAPNKQADMWEIDALNKSFDLLQPNGWLTTYCAKGQLKRDLRTVGFEVSNVPGPPGKREMTLAQKANLSGT